MKSNRNAEALAVQLRIAAVTPLPLPMQKPQDSSHLSSAEAADTNQIAQAVEKPAKAAKVNAERAQITLRLLRSLLDDYTFEAAERTKIERRVVSAQEIMLEILERGRPKVAQ